MGAIRVSRGQYTPELVRRGWEVVGVDSVPTAIEAARRKAIPGARFEVADVTARGPGYHVAAALPDWELLSVEDAETAGLDWPMSRMQPQWFRLRLR